MLPTHADSAWILPHASGSRHTHQPLSRRRFLAGAAGVLGAAAAAPVLAPIPANAKRRQAKKKTDPTPNPITGGFTFGDTTFHVLSFGPWIEPSTITDFNGFSGVCDVQGTGTATNPDGSTETLLFDTDMRFMKGSYMAVDGAMHHGTFGFV